MGDMADQAFDAEFKEALEHMDCHDTQCPCRDNPFAHCNCGHDDENNPKSCYYDDSEETENEMEGKELTRKLQDSVDALTVKPDIGADIERVLLGGDLGKLTSEQRLSYYKALCESLGLNPLTQPFEYLTLNGKLVLYAKKTAAEQLRLKHGVSVTDMKAEVIQGVYVVTVSVQDAKGRTDMGTGAVTVEGQGGDKLANAIMKAETKAKRRATLSICGLGMLDETELETIPGAVKFDREQYAKAKVAELKGETQPEEKPKSADIVGNDPVVFDRFVHEDGKTGEAQLLVRKVRDAVTKSATPAKNGKPYVWVEYGDEQGQALTCFDTALFDELRASVGSTINVMFRVGSKGDSITAIVPEQQFNPDSEPSDDEQFDKLAEREDIADGMGHPGY